MSTIQSQSSPATLLWDHQDLIPLQKNLGEEDLVLLLTPAVVPLDQSPTNASDPFEPLGKALARTHPWIRHVPYSKERGITDIHVAFIKRARVVIFVLTGFSTEEGLFQLELAEVAREGARADGFPTLIQCPGYFVAELQAVAVLLTSERPTTEATPKTRNSPPPPTWPLLKWDYDRDLPETHALWEACLPSKFHLNRSTLGSLLKRDGYAMHYLVREPHKGESIGFCATFTTFTDSSGDRLIGSIAAIIVHKDFRGQGVGRFLHDEVVRKLKNIRGVGITQLGSTFPRLLYGLPVGETDLEWFEKLEWNMKESTLGNGRRVLDWLLRFADHPVPDLASAGLTFRPCQLKDYEKVVEMANKESQKKYRFGWYDQYAKTMDSCYMNDIASTNGQNTKKFGDKLLDVWRNKSQASKFRALICIAKRGTTQLKLTSTSNRVGQ
uniref:N-acetyltransferase domain-containing protein n=1 Tax=Fusarium oxysporum (strain Fo5176) TaxID=660025 RepID=A0A0D2YD34_FUSOF